MNGAREKILDAVERWTDVTVHQHRSGGTGFRLGKRELGHLHDESMLDIPFPMKIRNELVLSGMAQEHHMLPKSVWVSFYIRTAGDVEQAIALLGRSFDVAMSQASVRAQRSV